MRVSVVSISTIALLAATAPSVFPESTVSAPRLPMNPLPLAHPTTIATPKPKPKPSITPEQARHAVAELRARHLLLPIQGFNPESIKGSFYEKRGTEMHEAADMLAPRNTPVIAVEDGTIAKLWMSKAGGITIYQFDASQRYVYYYAHLESYAPNLKDGDIVKRGQIIGFVGTSGNAPPNTPHLHFSISVVTEPGRWWSGAQIDPYEVFTNNGRSEPTPPRPPRKEDAAPPTFAPPRKRDPSPPLFTPPPKTSTPHSHHATPSLPDKVRIYEI
jgi:murein DD-endopeptidase MepM/ murein hydrolase activator NlpD